LDPKIAEPLDLQKAGSVDPKIVKPLDPKIGEPLDPIIAGPVEGKGMDTMGGSVSIGIKRKYVKKDPKEAGPVAPKKARIKDSNGSKVEGGAKEVKVLPLPPLKTPMPFQGEQETTTNISSSSSSSSSSASTPEIILDNEKNILNIEKNDLKTSNIFITKLSDNHNNPLGDKDFTKNNHMEIPNPSTLNSVSTKGDISPVRSHKFIQPPKFEESDFTGL